MGSFRRGIRIFRSQDVIPSSKASFLGKAYPIKIWDFLGKAYPTTFILLFLNITITLSAGELKINVTNIKINIGSIHYALYDDPRFFPDEEGKIDGGNKRIDEVVANGILIKELNESYYAVAIYHDENSNKKFDTFLSLPKEQYGFSNNAPVFLAHRTLKMQQFLLNKIKPLKLRSS